MAKKTSARSKGYRKYAKPQKTITLTKSDWKKIAIGIAALIAIIILVVLLYDDGSLDVKDGTVIVEGEHPLVFDVGENSLEHKYYKGGELTGPAEGFSMSEVSYVTDENVPLYYFVPDDAENCPISRYTITAYDGVYSEGPANSMDNIAIYMRDCIMGEDVYKEIGGHNVAYYTYVYSKYDDSGENITSYVQNLTAYTPSGDDKGYILISLIREMDTQDDGVDTEVLEEYLAKIMPTINRDLKN